MAKTLPHLHLHSLGLFCDLQITCHESVSIPYTLLFISFPKEQILNILWGTMVDSKMFSTQKMGLSYTQNLSSVLRWGLREHHVCDAWDTGIKDKHPPPSADGGALQCPDYLCTKLAPNPHHTGMGIQISSLFLWHLCMLPRCCLWISRFSESIHISLLLRSKMVGICKQWVSSPSLPFLLNISFPQQ